MTRKEILKKLGLTVVDSQMINYLLVAYYLREMDKGELIETLIPVIEPNPVALISLKVAISDGWVLTHDEIYGVLSKMIRTIDADTNPWEVEGIFELVALVGGCQDYGVEGLKERIPSHYKK